MFKNGHVIAAMLVAPVLAILSYFAVDYMVSEEPVAARAGESYQLVARSNCRYESGECVMENGDFRLTITAESTTPGRVQLKVNSLHPLQGIQAAWLTDPEQPGQPETLRPLDASGRLWQGEVAAQTLDEPVLRLVVKAGEAYYYGETLARFMDYHSSYGEDFRASRKE